MSKSLLLSRWPARIFVGVLAGCFFLFLGVPLVALLFHEPPGLLWAAMQQPEALQALQLSIYTTSISTLLTVLFGLPVAYVLARMQFPGRLIGRYLTPLGLSIPFTTLAVILAQVFVSSPFFINTAKAGLEQLDRRYEQAAYTLRASPFYAFRRVVMPLIRPALLTGIGLAWARALGELGATITFAGNFPGVTQTMPIAVYIAAESDLDTAVALSVVLLAVSFGLLLALRIGRGRLVG
ncbi:MAG: ABC transporter permease subunit [Chloroflexi bacterium]|nr:MAG: ABC transporter permease subunit [Chloroflexota bacterium]